MKISTKGRYALRVMIDLAQHNNGGYIALKDIAERQNISVKYLESIVSALHKSGFVLSMRGKEGGYRLAKNPDKYTVASILSITEGSLAVAPCTEGGTSSCQYAQSCPTIEFWCGLNNVVKAYLESYTVQDFLDRQDTYII